MGDMQALTKFNPSEYLLSTVLYNNNNNVPPPPVSTCTRFAGRCRRVSGQACNCFVVASCPGWWFHRLCHQHEAHATHVGLGSHSLYRLHLSLRDALSCKCQMGHGRTPWVCSKQSFFTPLQERGTSKSKRSKASRLRVGVNGRLSMAGTPRPELDHPGFFFDESTGLRALLAWHACLPSFPTPPNVIPFPTSPCMFASLEPPRLLHT